MHQCAGASKREKQLILGLPLFGCVSILVRQKQDGRTAAHAFGPGSAPMYTSNPVPLLSSIQWNLQTRLRPTGPPFTPGQATALLDLIEVLTALCINSVLLLLAQFASFLSVWDAAFGSLGICIDCPPALSLLQPRDIVS